MADRDNWLHLYLVVRCEIPGFAKKRAIAKAFAKYVFIDQELKLGDRIRSDTVLVLTVNNAG